MTKFFGVRNGFVASFATSLLGGMAILFFGMSNPDLMPFFVGIARMGVSSGFNLLYIVNTEIFPTLFAATAMGICNFLARIVTIMSPQVAEWPGDIPMMTYSLFCLGGIALTLFLKIKQL